MKKNKLAEQLAALNTPGLTTTQLEIIKRNTAFAKASSAGKRVFIAKDVIEQIDKKRLLPKRGSWLNVVESDDAGGDFRDDMLEGTISCSCCALGAMMACSVMIKDGVSTGSASSRIDGHNLLNGGDTSTGLADHFSLKQLALIEFAFEGGNGAATDDPENAYATAVVSAKDAERCRKFMGRLADPTDRMLRIMRNIVKNKGTFNP